jgi:hypothetical protein
VVADLLALDPLFAGRAPQIRHPDESRHRFQSVVATFAPWVLLLWGPWLPLYRLHGDFVHRFDFGLMRFGLIFHLSEWQLFNVALRSL